MFDHVRLCQKVVQVLNQWEMKDSFVSILHLNTARRILTLTSSFKMLPLRSKYVSELEMF